MNQAVKVLKKLVSDPQFIATFIALDFSRFLLEYLVEAHPDCIARAVIHYSRLYLD